MSDHPAPAGAAARFLVVAQMPMLVLGLQDDAGAHTLWTRLSLAGMVQLPAFYGVQYPRGVRVGLTMTFEHMRLEDESADGLLQVPRPAVDVDWLGAAKRLRGSMLSVGRELELDPDADDQAICNELDSAAADGRVLGAIVGLAEKRDGLPMFF